MVTERFPLPPPELRSGGDDLYDYLYQTAERLNLLLQDLTGAAGESSGAQITGGAIQVGLVSLSGAVNAPATVGDATGMATAALSVSGGAAAIDLGGETLAQYVDRMVHET